MYSYTLFFGFPVDPLFEKELSKVNPHMLDQFIQTGGDHLEERVHLEMRYLGKDLGSLADLQTIELLEANIFSILKKIVPDFEYNEIPLMLFPIPKISNEK